MCIDDQDVARYRRDGYIVVPDVLSAQDVQELGQLVDAGLAQPFAERCEALLVGEQVAGSVTLVGHRAELQDLEWSATDAGASLAEQDWRAVLAPHSDRDGPEQRRQHGKPRRRCHDVEASLGESIVECRRTARHSRR